MNLRAYLSNKGRHFVAMEYYGLVLNRTFLILVTDDYLIGLKVNGLVSEVTKTDPLIDLMASPFAIKDNLENPYSYIKDKYLKKISDLDIHSDEILKINSSNFKINREDIAEVAHVKGKKWGMGDYPHDGKVTIKTREKGIREFIVLGSQSGSEIEKMLGAAPTATKAS
jgi:hypothetical protein